ncbi:MAG: rod shape-determining protein RodA [Microthrixaceae bacterium]|nr:rod shape-determining protein RodA [Microthrixaceae bacterium]MCO5317234.1 rod shape-determining protein RodA [Microthrixaceae bacterium]
MHTSTGRSSTPRVAARDLTAPWHHVDGVLAAVVGVILVMGSVMVYGATRYTEAKTGLVVRHVGFIVVGVALGVFVATVDYRRLLAWWPFLYGGSVLLLLGVLTPLGATVNGTSGWYRLGPLSFQPAELAKLATIISVAAFLGAADRVDWQRLAVALGLLAVPLGLVLAQPDLGSALVFAAIALGMLVVGGVRLRHLVALGVLAVAGVALVVGSGMLDDYQQDRLSNFLSTDGQSYNVTQAQTAISSGGLTGYGFGEGPQTRGGFVPVQESDFIFTVVGEEFGFIGSGLLVALLGVLIWRIWRVAQIAADSAGTLICVGVLSMFLFHIFENIGMTLGMMPVTGIPLPFVSYGGSSIVASCVAVGLVESVHMHRFTR